MKIIEEKINENCKKAAITGYGKTCYSMGFKEGIEVAKQWISVKDALPKNFYVRCLVDNGCNEYMIAAYTGKRWFFPTSLPVYELTYEVKFWRPI